MAYDKVVDSTVLDAGLKQVADAIREKGGTSDNLAFPTGMAAAIAAIQTGGGGVTIQSGSFTPTENLTEYTIAVHGTVKNFCFWKHTDALTSGVRTYIGSQVYDGATYQIQVCTNGAGTSLSAVYAVAARKIVLGEGQVKIIGIATTNPGYLVPQQYDWIAW